MVDIETMYLRLVTVKDVVDSGSTDGDVFLGIGGREFSIDSEKDDFENGQDRWYILGKIPSTLPVGVDIVPVRHSNQNDPRYGYKLKTENLYKYPVYIRFEPQNEDDNWGLEDVTVYVNPAGRPPFFTYHALEAQDEGGLYLGTDYTKYCYLHRTQPPVPASLPDGTRGL
jgi:hypothetical protein